MLMENARGRLGPGRFSGGGRSGVLRMPALVPAAAGGRPRGTRAPGQVLGRHRLATELPQGKGAGLQRGSPLHPPGHSDALSPAGGLRRSDCP